MSYYRCSVATTTETLRCGENWEINILTSLCPKLLLGPPIGEPTQNPGGKGTLGQTLEGRAQSLAEKVGNGYEVGHVKNDVKICDVIKATENYLVY